MSPLEKRCHPYHPSSTYTILSSLTLPIIVVSSVPLILTLHRRQVSVKGISPGWILGLFIFYTTQLCCVLLNHEGRQGTECLREGVLTTWEGFGVLMQYVAAFVGWMSVGCLLISYAIHTKASTTSTTESETEPLLTQSNTASPTEQSPTSTSFQSPWLQKLHLCKLSSNMLLVMAAVFSLIAITPSCALLFVRRRHQDLGSLPEVLFQVVLSAILIIVSFASTLYFCTLQIASVKNGNFHLNKACLVTQMASLLCLGLVQVRRPTSGFTGGGHFVGEEFLYAYFVYWQIAVHYWAISIAFLYALLTHSVA